MSSAKVPAVIIFMADNGQDPTETAVSWKAMSDAGFTTEFATEKGAVAAADPKMLEKSLFGNLMGASKEAASTYEEMVNSSAFQHPHAWEQEGFDILKYDAIVLPGGHAKPIRQYLESPTLQKHLARFWPYVRRDYSGKAPGDQIGPKVVGAICHGALCLAFAKSPETGKSLLHEVESTTLPRFMERTAWAISQPWGLRDYYRTYGPEGRWCDDDITLAGGRYIRGSMGTSEFSHTDPNYRYVSARFPGDTKLFASKVVAEIRAALA